MNIQKIGQIEPYLDKLLDWCVSLAGKLILALLLIAIGLKMIHYFVKFLHYSFERHGMEASVRSFLISFINIGLKTLLFLIAAGVLGINMTSFLTLLGSAGIAVGLAVQGSLSNIAGGILILILKPFKVGDYIIEDNKGNEGTVTGIDIFYTKLQSVDNKTIVIPNGVLSNCSLTNVTKQDKRRLDLFVSIEYSEDIRRVKEVLMDILNKQENVIKEDGIDIFVNSLDASSISIGFRVWVPMDLYWVTRWSVLEEIKVTFDEHGIVFPFNQLDVNLVNSKEGKAD